MAVAESERIATMIAMTPDIRANRRAANSASRRKVFCRTGLAVVAVVLVIGLGAGCGRSPQFAGNRECLAAADALWTAVTAKRTELVDQSAAEIERLHAQAQLSDEAFDALSRIVADARAGNWDAARTALKTLLRGQRRGAS